MPDGRRTPMRRPEVRLSFLPIIYGQKANPSNESPRQLC